MEQLMIQATIRMTVPAQKRGALLEIVRPVMELSRDDSDCLNSYLYEDLEEKNVIVLEQVWSAGESLDRHIRSDEYRNLLLALELGVKQPVIRFDTIAGSTGIETIEKARNRIG
jgi:quinol monooxygenase YgiN